MKKSEHVIQEVVAKKNGIILKISSKEYLLNSDDYLEGFYYPGKELSDEEFLNIKSSAKNKRAKDYLLQLLSQGRYTHQEIKRRLAQKFSLSDTEIDNLLAVYIENGMISDELYANDFIEAKSMQGYGRRYIKARLKEKGISDSIEKALSDRYPDEKEMIDSLIIRYDKSKSALIVEKRKESIHQSLVRRGFSPSLIQKELQHFYSSMDEEARKAESEKRRVLLKKEADKCYNALCHKDWPEAKKKDAFIRKLMSKGFHYEEIEEISKEYLTHDQGYIG